MSQIVKIIIIFSIAYLLLGLAVVYASPEDVKVTLETTCKSYKTYCKVNVDLVATVPRGYTTYEHKIFLSQGKGKRGITEDELLAVGLHEVGHVVLNHHRRYEAFLNNIKSNNIILTKEMIKTVRHQHETEADFFATMMAQQLGMHNYLPEALHSIVGDKLMTLETNTHPATIKRIENIHKFEEYLNSYYGRTNNK